VPKRSDRPETRTAHPMPARGSEDWVVWAAWADRITFEEIEETTGLSEAEVIVLMRRRLPRSRFRRWRARASAGGLKHRRRFEVSRSRLRAGVGARGWAGDWDPDGEREEE